MARYSYNVYAANPVYGENTTGWKHVTDLVLRTTSSPLNVYNSYSLIPSQGYRPSGTATSAKYNEVLGKYTNHLTSDGAVNHFVSINSSGSDFISYRVMELKAPLTGYVRGNFERVITAEEGIYPDDGYHRGSHQHDVTKWYIKTGLVNDPPVITDTTENNKSFAQNEVLNLKGTVLDTDAGDVITIRYKINGGATRAIATGISTGSSPISYNKALTYSDTKLYDGETAVTGILPEGGQNSIVIWAEDDKGGKSAEITRLFYVVHNRPPVLSINEFTETSDLIDSEFINISGVVSDPDGGKIKVRYRVRDNVYTEIHNAVGGAFGFDIPLSDLKDGNNIVTIQSEDNFGAITSKTLTVKKAKDKLPLKESTIRYKLNPPNGSAKGIILWVEREDTDLILEARISMVNSGEPEDFNAMTKNLTAYVSTGVVEDEFIYEGVDNKTDIIIEIVMQRMSLENNSSITLISGVLS